MAINDTHDPSLQSWVASANSPDGDFPIQNLPHGVFSTADGPARGGIAIGDQVLDMQAAAGAGLFDSAGKAVAGAAAAAGEADLRRLMATDAETRMALRRQVQALLRVDSPLRPQVAPYLVPMALVRMHMPVRPGAFTDFMTSAPHIAAARPARAQGTLPPCFHTLPIAYNSRASSVVESGRPVERPLGQHHDGTAVVFAPTRALDYELEFACLIAGGNPLGTPITMQQARQHIFGYCLLNDWSARDVQMWESVLGPFQAKAFRTSISPWVVTAEALAPFRKPMPARPADAPPLPEHLFDAGNQADGGLAIRFVARLRTPRMQDAAEPGAVLTDTDFDSSSWSFEQMIVHHAIGGCNLEPGDILSSGTLSGIDLSSAACMAEITGGRVPVAVGPAEQRLWLEDGDELAMTARASREGYVAIGFGECAGRVLPAPHVPAG